MKRRVLGAAVVVMTLLMVGGIGTAAVVTLDCTATHDDGTGNQVPNTITWFLSTWTQPTGPNLQVSGTCNEGPGFSITEKFSSMTLDGGDATTIVASGDAITVRGATAVTIKNLTIPGGSGAGINIRAGAATTVDHVIITNRTDIGIIVSRAAYAVVINSTIQSCGDGIQVYEGGVARIGYVNSSQATANPNLIENNVRQGIKVQRLATAAIVGNQILNNGQNGIWALVNSTIEAADNTISGNGWNGIAVSQGAGAMLGGSTGIAWLHAPNQSDAPNAGFGVSCSLGGWVDGVRGSLTGTGRKGAVSFTEGCINSLQ
jgi:hypothetical protein